MNYPEAEPSRYLVNFVNFLKNLPFFKLFRLYPDAEHRGILLIKLVELSQVLSWLLSEAEVSASLVRVYSRSLRLR